MLRGSLRFIVPVLLCIAGPVHAQGELELNTIELRPGYQQPLEAVHPAYTLEQARPDGFEPQTGAVAFSPDGRYLAVATFPPSKDRNRTVISEPNGTLYILENPTAADPADIIIHRVSDELLMPLGACWLDSGLYIAERDEISVWTDTTDDGLPENKETFASGWISDNFHHFTFGLGLHDGQLYATLSTSLGFSPDERETLEGPVIAGNAPNPEFRGGVMQVDIETGEIEWIAGGLRTPNGIGIGPEGIVLCPDNQGDWVPSNCIYVASGGEFFGKYNNTEATTSFYPDGGVASLFSDRDPTPPAIWLPQNEIGNSPSATLLIPEGQPHAGQVLLADVTQGAIHRVFMEEVNGTWQGAAFRHSMGFEAGPNDITWGPDGCLYVGHIGFGAGNWGWQNRRFGLQRLRLSGEDAFEFEKIESTADGFRVSFTEVVPLEQLSDQANWLIDAWTSVAQPQYGGPKIDEHMVRPTAIRVAEDRMSVELVIEDRRPNFVYHIRTDPTSDSGRSMWSPEAWVTFHQAPGQ